MTNFKKIFIIDDDLIFVFLLKKILSKLGYQNTIVHFLNGQEAFDELNNIIEKKMSLPDLIFLDINMPVMDGWQFLELLKNYSFDTKLNIYMVSSTINKNEIEKINSNDFINGFLPKPIDFEVLKKIIN